MLLQSGFCKRLQHSHYNVLSCVTETCFSTPTALFDHSLLIIANRKINGHDLMDAD